MSEWEKVLCCTAQGADHLHPNYINNAKLKSREKKKRNFQKSNIRLLLSKLSFSEDLYSAFRQSRATITPFSVIN